MSDQATPALRGAMVLIAISYTVCYIAAGIQHHSFQWLHLLWFLVAPGVWFLTWLIFPDYWWWPNHIEDRVRRIHELVDGPECKNPPGENA
jgi:hypothetical protein